MNKKVFILQLFLLGITARTALAQETIDPEDAVTTQHQAVFNGQTVLVQTLHSNHN